MNKTMDAYLLVREVPAPGISSSELSVALSAKWQTYLSSSEASTYLQRLFEQGALQRTACEDTRGRERAYRYYVAPEIHLDSPVWASRMGTRRM